MADPRSTAPVAAPAVAHWEVVLPDEHATGRLAMDLAALLQAGDVVALEGDLGAGKSTLARALIRELAQDPLLEVPSPTFTLIQTYDLPRHRVVHADLYRLGDSSELEEIGWYDLTDGAVTLVEWPERAGEGALPANRLELRISIPPDAPEQRRRVRLLGHGRLAGALQRMRAIRSLIDTAGFGPAQRRHLQGDASTRTYERLVGSRRNAVLMNAPRRPDGPPVRDGKPYSAIAHIAEDVKPFVALARGLKGLGFSAPTIYAADLEAGLLVMEDLGEEGVLAGTPPAPMPERYEVAVDVLAALHASELPDMLPVAPGIDHVIPPYDLEAMLIEVELLLDWYLPHRGLPPAGPLARASFRRLWTQALAGSLAQAPTWVLRDYHSPNLMWIEERDGLEQIGLLDFQDALMGPPAYDVVSLTQDARVDVPEELELALLGRYLKARRAEAPDFDLKAFAASYAVMGAQRATKILGIFARLNHRDGKPGYLRHIPRIWLYLQRSLAFTDLAPLRAWFAQHVPPPEGEVPAEMIRAARAAAPPSFLAREAPAPAAPVAPAPVPLPPMEAAPAAPPADVIAPSSTSVTPEELGAPDPVAPAETPDLPPELPPDAPTNPTPHP